MSINYAINLSYFRMKMVDGDFTEKAIASCFARLSATFVCVYLGKDLMVVRPMLVQEHESGYLIMVV